MGGWRAALFGPFGMIDCWPVLVEIERRAVIQVVAFQAVVDRLLPPFRGVNGEDQLLTQHQQEAENHEQERRKVLHAVRRCGEIAAPNEANDKCQ